MRNITEAANELNISRRTIYNKIQELDIKTSREGKNSFLSDEDFLKIKERVNCEIRIGETPINEHVQEHENSHVNIHERTKNILRQDRNSEGYVSIREYKELQAKLEALETRLEKSYSDRIESLESQLKQKDLQLQNNSEEIKGLIMSIKTSIEQLPSSTAKDEALVSLDASYHEGAVTMEEPKSFWNKIFGKK